MKKYACLLIVLLATGCSAENEASQQTNMGSKAEEQETVSSLMPTEQEQQLSVEEQAMAMFMQMNLGIQVKQIYDSPVPGLKEVITNKGVFYASPDGKYLIAGRVFNLNDGFVNETDKTLAKLRVQGLSQFEGSTILYPAEEEKFHITVFTDITCGYCRKLHHQIEEYNDLGITIEYMAYPRYGLNHPSFQDLQSIWCADDPAEALTDAKAGKAVQPKYCSNKLTQQFHFAQSIGVNATPAIVTDSGQLISGYLPPEDLLQKLQQVEGQHTAQN